MSRKRAGELEISQDLGWQRRSWRVQRVAWGLLVVFLAAAALGLLGGDGPFREATAGPSAAIEYDRFTRLGSPTELRITPPANAASPEEVEIAVAGDYLGEFEITSVLPEPASVRTAEDELIYTFAAGESPGAIAFSLEPRKPGVQSGEVRIGAGEPVRFSQVVYP